MTVLLCLVSSCSLIAIQNEVAKKNIPVRFYGRVVDQYSNAVPDVIVSITLRHWHETVPGIPNVQGTMINTQKVTGSDGLFEWTHGASGDVLYIESIVKDGYLLSPNTPHSFGPSSGSVERPIMFEVWKK